MNILHKLNQLLDHLFCVHDYMMFHDNESKPKRMYLVCMKCGKETKGWNL